MSLDKLPQYSIFRAKFEGFSFGQSKKKIDNRGVKARKKTNEFLEKTKKSLRLRLSKKDDLLEAPTEKRQWAVKQLITEPESIVKFESLCVRCQLSTNLSLWLSDQCRNFLLQGFGGNWHKMLHHFHDIRPVMNKMGEYRLEYLELLIKSVQTDFPELKWQRVGDASNEPSMPVCIILERATEVDLALKNMEQKVLDYFGKPLHVALDVRVYTHEVVNKMTDVLGQMDNSEQSFYQALMPGHSRKDLMAKLGNLVGVILSEKKDMSSRTAAFQRLLKVIDKQTPLWSILDTPVLYEIAEKLYQIASNEQLDIAYKKDAVSGLMELCYHSEDDIVSLDAARRIYHLTKPDDGQAEPGKVKGMALKALIQLAKQGEDSKAQALAVKELCLIITNEEGVFPEYYRKEAKQVISCLIDSIQQENTLLEDVLARGLRYISSYGGELATYWARAKQSRVHENLTDTVSHFG